MDSAHALLQGLATRMQLDAGLCATDTAAERLSLHLSAGAEPADAADWLDGFLNRNAQVLLHDATVWQLVDQWLATLSEDAFVRVLPMVRRSFAAFGPGERRDLGQRGYSALLLGAKARRADHRRVVPPERATGTIGVDVLENHHRVCHRIDAIGLHAVDPVTRADEDPGADDRRRARNRD